MLTLRNLLSLPVFLSTTIISYALAAPGSSGYIDIDTKDTNLDYAASLTGGETCDDKQLKQIKEGFHDMNKLFVVAQDLDWTHEAEVEFFGRSDRIEDYKDMIVGNLKRAAQYANMRGNTTKNLDVHVRCDDPNNICDEGGKKDGKHTVYNIGNEPHVNFCKRYFDLDPLDEQVDDESGDDQSKLKLTQYYNRAIPWARMIMHFKEVGKAVVMTTVANKQPNATSEWTTVASEGPMNTSVLAGVMDEKMGPNNIRVLKYAYGVTRAKLLATLSTQNAYDAANNAENYALFALARYVEQKKGFFPNMPDMNFGNDMAVLTSKNIQNGDSKKYACFDMLDVVPRKQETNEMGGALPSAANSRISDRSGQRTALLWVVILCSGILAIG